MRLTVALAIATTFLCTDGAAQGLLRSKLDTAYIGRPKEAWTFKVRLNQSGSTVKMEGNQDGTAFSTQLGSQMKSTVSVAASYRGLSAGLALNPMKMLGKYSDFELNMNAYSNRVGLDVVYAQVNSYTGTLTWDGADSDVESGLVEQRMLTVSGYYAFNGSRFSYPAAFTQSQVQRRSCGSWLLGATLMWGYYEHGGDLQGANESARMKVRQLGIGGGYGYNLVLKKGWLVHFSSVPQLTIYANDRIESGSERQDAPFHFPNIIVTGRVAVVRSFGNKFIGLTGVVNRNAAGLRSKVHIENVKWRGRLFFGFRI